MSSKPARQIHAGFTLLEMAIVIAVIALLIGGILSGRTFLANAEIKALMSESQIYIDAFNRFNKKYGSVPGDYKPAAGYEPWPATTTRYGDGNGFIRTTGAGSAANDIEPFAAFQQLALAEFIKGSYSGFRCAIAMCPGNSIAILGDNIPESVIPGVGYFFDHPDTLSGTINAANIALAPNDAIYFDGQYGHVLRVAGNTDGDIPKTGFLTPTQMLALDGKYDDGMPDKGLVSAYRPTVATNTTDCVTYNAIATVNQYNTQLTGKVCYFFIDIPGS